MYLRKMLQKFNGGWWGGGERAGGEKGGGGGDGGAYTCMAATRLPPALSPLISTLNSRVSACHSARKNHVKKKFVSSARIQSESKKKISSDVNTFARVLQAQL